MGTLTIKKGEKILADIPSEWPQWAYLPAIVPTSDQPLTVTSAEDRQSGHRFRIEIMMVPKTQALEKFGKG